jgi:predicted dehydrogenase
MDSRRTFIKTLGKSAALTAFAASTPGVFSSPLFAKPVKELKPLRIGIIGAENSHTAGFGRMFNVDKKFPEAEVKYVWGETEDFARKAAEEGKIPNIVKDPLDMLGEIDALIVDHRHAKYHLEAATPFILEGIPAFIDKPFCYRASEGEAFLELARRHGTPVTSYSTIAHSAATFDIKEQLADMGNINQVIRTGPVEMDSPYGGIFFYGVHIVQPLMYIFGEDIDRVRVSRNGQTGNASLVYKNGLLVTLILKNISHGWETFVETEDGRVELKSRVDESDPAICYTDMVDMFRTGKEPRSHASILNCVRVLEALEKSVESQDWEKTGIPEIQTRAI